MKKLVLTVGLIAVFMVGSFAAIPARSIDPSAANAESSDLSMAVARSAGLRLSFINQALYPDDAAPLRDWLCDGMAPCIQL